MLSCGPEPDPYDYYIGFYNPSLPARDGFEPFYYTGLAEYYGSEVAEEDINLRDWHAFFSGRATAKDIREFVYTYAHPQMTALYNHIEKGSPLEAPDSVRKNTLTQYFISSKDRETLGYLMYAKQCEAHTGGKDSWEAPVRDSATMLRLSRNGMQLYKACKDERIRERYAFQATRLAHYGRNYAQALQYYDSLAAPIRSTSLMHYKTLALKAGALMRTGARAQSAYIFSRVFELAPSQRQMAFLNVRWAGATEQQVLDLCKNNEEKATVAAMFAFRYYEPYPEGIRKIYGLHPQSPMLNVLLEREITKLEDGYLHNRLTLERYGSAGYHYADVPGSEVLELQRLADSLVAGGRVKEPALWQVSSAYLSYMLKDYAAARQKLMAAKAGAGRPALQDQWEIVRLLVTVSEQPRIGRDFEAELLESFKWLDSRLDTATRKDYYLSPDNQSINRNFYTVMYRNLLDYVVATRYQQQGDINRMALVLSKRDKVLPYSFNFNYVSATDFVKDSMQAGQLENLYSLLQQKKKTPFEQYLCREFGMTENQVGEAIAINYVRQHDFANAVNWFKKSGSSLSAGMAFTEQLEDFGLDTTEAGISQLEYAATMLDLEKKMKKGKAAAEDYYKYATGLFSISYYGHSYHFSATYRPSTRWYQPGYDGHPGLKQYFGCYRAEEYYKKAADVAQNPEFKARSLYMAARCAQKHLYDPNRDWYDLASEKNPHFRQLINDCGHTAFYKETFDRCSYLRDFYYMGKR
ncbi:hypothetical protein DLD77_02745 [Chitinophaga alhagiae]|uniref:Uncharacterized protein n=1 Tax=Chitinophaga alhagiae TaxID=2203219 RepID=A0ABM6W9Q3_9BACT|nr:hypothetical protein DLD77_02745 [Chitinophaga alhagiae]